MIHLVAGLTLGLGVAAAPAQPSSSGAAVTAAEVPPGAPAGVPNVFRCVFEDQPRMVFIRPAANLWVAFNPATCTIDKIWRGGMKFRGKVWDFSQDNCAPSDDALVWAERDRLCGPQQSRPSSGFALHRGPRDHRRGARGMAGRV